MTSRARIAITTVLLGLLVAIALGCSKSAPNGTGGGGGGSLELNSGTIAGGAQFAHTFMTAGTYNYCCSIHGCMAMSQHVTVANGNPMSDDVNIVDFAFSKTAAVAPGGTVTWHNTTASTPHTVTSN